VDKLDFAITSLTSEDITIIQDVSKQLQIWANVSQSDVFIDCLIPTGDAAMVVAEAHPENGKSLYKRAVKGEIALKENEPGVFHCLKTGEAVIGSRGISQENVSIQQNITPIKNKQNQTIAALILERDITEMVKKEKHVEVLMETTEQLSETLFQQAMKNHHIPELIHEGLLIFNETGTITFANERAHTILGESAPLIGLNVNWLFNSQFSIKTLELFGGIISEEFQCGNIYGQIKAVSIHKEGKIVGGILLLRDLTEMKEKDREIMIKSAVIKEIHHRVKNNLQTIASLLRLQMRRANSSEVEKVFRESINRIMSISVIHEVLSQDGLDDVDCKEIFEYMTKGIVTSMVTHEQPIHVEVMGDSLFLNSRNASSLALIINELIQNALNHAFHGAKNGRITISINHTSDVINITVTDNGAGFTYDPIKRGNLGLEICNTLVREDLNGSIHFYNTGSGTKVKIRFTVPEGEREHDEL
jgi:two-component sensor histidine kinase